jgi:cytochrome c553
MLAHTCQSRAWARYAEKLVSKRAMFVVTAILLAASSVLALDAEKIAPCVVCHGENGVSQNEGVPSLAAQPDQYIQWQLVSEEHHCNSCHTRNFAGQQATARLAGQREEVLRKALEDYRSGVRRGTGIAAMPEAVYGMTDDDFAKLSHYLSHLP